MKKIFALLLMASALLFGTAAMPTTTSDATSTESEIAAPQPRMVYANSYDGYVNVRAAASKQSKVVCKLYNGGDGAERLGTEGNWVKIRYDGKVGYVHRDYIQNTPTAPAYWDAADVVGVWSQKTVIDPDEPDFDLLIFDDGQFAMFSFQSPSGSFLFVGGKWRLEEDRIIMSLYGEDTFLTFVIDGNKMSRGGEIFIKRTFSEWIRKEDFLDFKKYVSNLMK